MLVILMFVLAYLLGSISSAILVSRLFKLPDPRTHGSNNPGATNVYRSGGSLPACLVLVFDILKGTIPVWGAYFLKLEPLELGLIAVAACLGHMYPLFFSFKGGKAVATAFGSLLPIGLSLGGLLIGTWLLIVAITRYSSLAALVAVTLAPLYTWWIKPLYTLPVTFITLLIIIRHRTNIVRLFKGEEPKVGTKQAPTDDKK
ncbi:glycerol-3-phosphate 1-O-acyltransferase PlsY [Pseudoalteromonas sp. SCSIO 43095]|uniref:glycerol-3-phosphate 1-O-acyltransferase PlsY n=1 Tax=Pseudoalteromonas TaxID=53246 RepID=UPI0008498D50|nr:MULTISPECIES: glycerol-3-phosphate 1-O-acyltransferase PlsY [Pseudoalteromonas]MCK8101923.1 glycerol-3-phosphate 1-O-acyltransferase PlsY [Pseudoalteromonas sp. 2CM36K]MCK8135089.1 glycerol-3-phosphate 1-O-acyltransferase PlsY [Pseudoalteromonas sp. 2CM28B]MDX1361782.1 glycerol-3-phosphate 1-O-acyltransferase PlsY [Pseudoalteromonas tetraodonis]ODS15871.1 glycerol-3-phosphate acyltransferase [Pseudoalteromonas tetraodonis]TMO25728.1 glycerol-3-phosphate 1-O-acyltransferase PlsY [Pseudoalter